MQVFVIIISFSGVSFGRAYRKVVEIIRKRGLLCLESDGAIVEQKVTSSGGWRQAKTDTRQQCVSFRVNFVSFNLILPLSSRIFRASSGPMWHPESTGGSFTDPRGGGSTPLPPRRRHWFFTFLSDRLIRIIIFIIIAGYYAAMTRSTVPQLTNAPL